MIIPVLARTPEGAKRLLSMIEGYGAAAAELAVPLKQCATACVHTSDWRRADQCCVSFACHGLILPALAYKEKRQVTQPEHALQSCIASCWAVGWRTRMRRRSRSWACAARWLTVWPRWSRSRPPTRRQSGLCSQVSKKDCRTTTPPSSLLHPRKHSLLTCLQHANRKVALWLRIISRKQSKLTGALQG